jgi:outer membrane receptor protein involved in Fe transport
MTVSTTGALRALLLSATALAGLSIAGAAFAEDDSGQTAGAQGPVGEVVVTASRTTRSAVTLSGQEAQKLLPGISPLKAIQTLPGVLYVTADPWGNNEQNESLFVHGFATQQLGYTMDGVPLGDQQYGNYNGLSPSRALTSENVSHVELSSGAGALGVASTSNLGGAIETYSSDPQKERIFDLRQTGGSYTLSRTFIRLDSGTFKFLGGDTTVYASGLHHDARAWDFDGHQRDDQANFKLVSEGARTRFTLFGDWDDKVEPNEDATAFGNQQTAAAAGFTPYTRPFLYPDIATCAFYLQPNFASTANGGNGGLSGTPPTNAGNNYHDCHSAAQRTDILTYAKLEWKVTDDLTWSNQAYYHNNYGRGIVAGPVNAAGLPGLFAAYYPQLVVDKNGNPVPATQAAANTTTPGTLANIAKLFGGTGLEVRTTEYLDNRAGLISTFDWNIGQHHVEAGLWWEHNEPTQHRVWYPFSSANNDTSPYTTPENGHLITQYFGRFFVNDVQVHIQDQWRVMPNVLLQAGWKASLQDANGNFPVEQVNAASVPTTSTSYVYYPQGKLSSDDWFLPQVGAVWDVTPSTHLFFNVQKNMRQFIVYGAGSNFYGTSPYSLGTQAAFDLFKQTVKPETAWTYEAGVRGNWTVGAMGLTAIDGQVNYYHVNFANRLFNVAPYNFINPAPAIIVNVGGVTTDGVDAAATLHFGPHFSAYEAVSYNKSTYDSNYTSGLTNGVPNVVPIGGKWVPLSPDWMSKTVLTTNWGPFELQLNGDYVGRRFVTYLNDLSVPSTFIVGLHASYAITPSENYWVKTAKISLNVTNLGNTKGVSTAVVTGASGGYQAFPIAPTQGFVTLQATF